MSELARTTFKRIRAKMMDLEPDPGGYGWGVAWDLKLDKLERRNKLKFKSWVWTRFLRLILAKASEEKGCKSNCVHLFRTCR